MDKWLNSQGFHKRGFSNYHVTNVWFLDKQNPNALLNILGSSLFAAFPLAQLLNKYKSPNFFLERTDLPSCSRLPLLHSFLCTFLNAQQIQTTLRPSNSSDKTCPTVRRLFEVTLELIANLAFYDVIARRWRKGGRVGTLRRIRIVRWP